MELNGNSNKQRINAGTKTLKAECVGRLGGTRIDPSGWI